MPVISKRVEARSGKRGTYYVYFLRMAPWAGQPSGGDIQIDKQLIGKRLYPTVAPGDAMCFDLHAGRLGVSWYRTIARCAESP